MSLIQLRARDGSVRGEARVDDADFAWLSQWRWCLYGEYAGRVEVDSDGGRLHIKMHRQIMGYPEEEVDHRDGDQLHNCRSNLRTATHAQNAQNRRPRRNSRSGVRGVSYHTSSGKWVARAMVDGRNHSLGVHETVELAAAAVVAFRRDNMPYSLEATPCQ